MKPRDFGTIQKNNTAFHHLDPGPASHQVDIEEARADGQFRSDA